MKTVVLITDLVLCLVFLGDFVFRLVTAPDRRAYMRVGEPGANYELLPVGDAMIVARDFARGPTTANGG